MVFVYGLFTTSVLWQVLWVIFVFSVGTCMVFFQEKRVSPTINPYGLSGFTQQKYTHFFGKWVALTHSTYGHTLYTLAKMGIFTL